MKEEQPKDESADEDEEADKEIKAAKQEIVAEDDNEGFTSVGAGGKATVNLTSENILTRLREVLESRGRKVI
jgi:translation initiation factor 3 subunit C